MQNTWHIPPFSSSLSFFFENQPHGTVLVSSAPDHVDWRNGSHPVTRTPSSNPELLHRHHPAAGPFRLRTCNQDVKSKEINVKLTQENIIISAPFTFREPWRKNFHSITWYEM
jgi:hypothetical protein